MGGRSSNNCRVTSVCMALNTSSMLTPSKGSSSFAPFCIIRPPTTYRRAWLCRRQLKSSANSRMNSRVMSNASLMPASTDAPAPRSTNRAVESDICGVLNSEFGDERFEKLRGGGAGGGELRFQPVHQGHQLIHFGHDPALFGERWEGNEEVPNQ